MQSEKKEKKHKKHKKDKHKHKKHKKDKKEKHHKSEKKEKIQPKPKAKPRAPAVVTREIKVHTCSFMGYIDYFWHLDDHKNGEIRTGNESFQVVGARRAPCWRTGIVFFYSVRCTVVNAYGLYAHTA